MGRHWKRRVVLLLAFCVAFSFSLLANVWFGAKPVQAKDSRAAIVISLSGTVMVTKAGGSNSYRASVDMSLNQGDHIRTESGSSITLQIVDQEDEVTIGENTELYISSLMEAGGGKKSKLKVFAGSLWFKVKKLVNADDEFEVETSTSIMGVRGSNGFIETRLGQIFAIMASGVLNATSTDSAGNPDSGEANIYPGQQFTKSESGDGGDPSVGVMPLDIDTFVQRASPEMITQLILTIQAIAEENAAMVEQVKNGEKQIDPKSGLNLSSQDTLSKFGDNLNSLVANIAKSAVDSNKVDAKEMDTLIAKVNETNPGEKIDLANVKPFDKTIASDPEVLKAKEAELARIEAERQAKLEETRRQEQERAQQNAALLNQLNEKKASQEEGNRQAQQEQKQNTENTYREGLSDAEKARFDTDKQKTEQQQTGGTPTSTPNPGTQQPSTTPGTGTGTQQPGTDTQEPEVPAPTTPVVLAPVNAVVTNAAQVSVRLQGTVGNTIRIWNSSLKVAEQTVGSNGEVTIALTLTEGTYALQADAVNSAGLASAKSSLPTIRVDRTAPNAPLLTSLPSYWNASSVKQLQIGAEAGSQLTVYLNEQTTPFFTTAMGSASSVTVPVSLSADGSYVFRAKASDAAGNTSGVASASVILDTVIPNEPTVMAPLYWNSVPGTTRQLTVTAAESNATVKVYRGSDPTPIFTGSYTGASLNVPITESADGVYTYRVTATDAAGNESAAASKTVTLDTAAPAAPTVTAPTYWNVTTGTGQQLTVTAAEANATIKAYRESESVPFFTGSFTGASLIIPVAEAVDGVYTYRVTATDPAGNEGSAETKIVTRDTVVPGEPTVVAPSYWNASTGTNQQFSITKAESNSTLKVYRGTASTPMFTGSFTGTPVTVPVAETVDGDYTYHITATDTAGNEGAAVTVTVALDTAAPGEPTVVAPAYWNAATSSKELTVTAPEENSTVKVYRGSESEPIYTHSYEGSPLVVTITESVDGEYTYRITVTDAAGNEGSAAVKTVKLDTEAPDAPTVNAPAYWNAATFSKELTVTGVEEGSTVKVFSGSGSEPIYTHLFEGTQLVVPITESVDGEYTYRITATDAAGNEGMASTKTVKLDTAAPGEPTVVAPAYWNAATGTNQQFSITKAESNSTLKVYRGAASTPMFTGSYTGTAVAVPVEETGDGEYTYRITATDAAGNEGAAVTVTVTLDTAVPAAPIVEAPAFWNAATGTGKQLTVTTPEENSTVKVYRGSENEPIYTHSYEGSPLVVTITESVDGEYTYRITVTDAAGNEGSAAVKTVKLDTAAPAAPTVEAPAYWNAATGTGKQLTVTAAEAGSTVKVYRESVTTPFFSESYNGSSLIVPVTESENGVKKYDVTATDAAGNESEPIKVTVTLDTIAPTGTVNVDGASAGIVTSTVVDLNLTSLDAVNMSFSLTNAAGSYSEPEAFHTVKSNFDLGSAGAKTVYVKLQDAAGNEATISTSVTVSGPGAPSFVSPPSMMNATDDKMLTLQSEAGATVYLYKVSESGLEEVSHGAVGSGNAVTLSVDSLPDGTYSLKAKAVRNNLESPLSSEISFTLDRIAPNDPTVTPGYWNAANTTRTITITAETGSTVKVYKEIEIEPFFTQVVMGTSVTVTVPDAEEGENNLQVTATDPAGNMSSVVTHTVILDSVAPNPPIIEAPAYWNAESGPYQINMTVEMNALVRVYRGESAEPIYSHKPEGEGPTADLFMHDPSPSEGANVYRFTVTDAAGNTSTTTVTVILDTTLPAISMQTPSEPVWTKHGTITVGLYTEAGASVQIYRDGTLIASGTAAPRGIPEDGSSYPSALNGQYNLSDNLTEDGEYRYQVQVTDSHNNHVSATVPLITVDRINPTIIAFGEPNSNGTSSYTSPYQTLSLRTEPFATVTIRRLVGSEYLETVGHSADEDGNVSIPYVFLAQGYHGNLSAKIQDRAGNTGYYSLPPATLNTASVQVANTIDGQINFNTVNLNLTLNYSPGNMQMSFSNTGVTGSYSAWEPYIPTKTGWQLSSGVGSKTVYVRLMDEWGNVFDPITASVTVVAPSFTSSSPIVWGSSSVKELQVNGLAGTRIDLYRVGESEKWREINITESGEAAISLSTIAEGTYTFYLVAVSGSLVSPASAQLQVTVDLTPPSTPDFVSPTQSFTRYTTTTIAVQGAEPGVITLRKDGELPVSRPTDGANKATFEVEISGYHLFSAMLTDAAGNNSPEMFIPITLDQLEPTVTIMSQTASPSYSTSFILDVQTSENGTFKLYKMAGDPPAEQLVDSATAIGGMSTTFSVSGLSGTTPFYVIATDLAGNETRSDILTYTVLPVAANGVVIQEGAATGSRDVHLTITRPAEAFSEMKLAQTSDFSSSSWESYSSTRTYQLSPGLGSKTVYVKFRTSDGYEVIGSSATTQLAPEVSLKLDGETGQVTVYPGEIIPLEVMMENFTGHRAVYGVEVHLEYDDQIEQLSGVTDGTVLEPGHFTSVYQEHYTEVGKEWIYVATNFGITTDNEVSEEGERLVTLQLRLPEWLPGPIRITKVLIVNASNEIVGDSTVTNPTDPKYIKSDAAITFKLGELS